VHHISGLITIYKMAGKVEVNKGERPPVKQHDIKMLDLAFAMDCTSSMSPYINSARDNIRQIVEEIVQVKRGMFVWR